jgi:hypothetical protein
MLKKLLLTIFLLVVFLALTAAQIPNEPGIASPQSGDIIQGKIKIKGSTSIKGFQSAEISYAYDRKNSDTWFLLNQMNKPVNNGTLANWDTSTITDGEFKLRLRITIKDGNPKEYVITGLRVRNYTEIETNTPAPTSRVQPALKNTLEPAITPNIPTSTSLPPNPARVSSGDLLYSLLTGGAFVIILFTGWGLYLFIRKTLH